MIKLSEEEIRAMAPPKPPLTRTINESHSRRCPKCSSSSYLQINFVWQFPFFSTILICDSDECENRHGYQTTKKGTNRNG
jgi:hypothetical protein